MGRRLTRAGFTAGLITVLAGCSTAASSDPAPTDPAATGTVPASSLPTTSTGAVPAVSACTAYAGSTGGARQVVATASTKPINGPFAALVLVNLRGITSTAAVPLDPQLDAAFGEVTAAIDDLADQLSRGLPPGADPTTTSVDADPGRLGTALAAADALCAARGVQPKTVTATIPPPSTSQPSTSQPSTSQPSTSQSSTPQSSTPQSSAPAATS